MSSISYDGNGLIIDGEHVVLYGGEFQYFRTNSSMWEDRIKKMAQGGCNLVTTYIPWNWHEKDEGVLKWDGEQDLQRFLDLCAKHDMYVIVKPGPYICAEWDFGGYPHWIYPKKLELRVAHDEYLELTRKWFDNVAEVIKPYLITNGGKIVMVQVENEYDHLIKLKPEVYGSTEDARTYILKLLEFVRDAGIDVPAYSNDGSCIFGTEIINTNTYYPNIPWLVMWVFDFFDDQLAETRREQPDKPLVVMEAQSGWFTQTGQPYYDLPLNAFRAVVKSIGVHAPSVINYYMYTGGTNFPYWGSLGDFPGTAMTTSYDFGGAPVSEWGEMRERYAYSRLWAYFQNSFPGMITGGNTIKDTKLICGSEGQVVLYPDGPKVPKDFKDTDMWAHTMSRVGKDQSAVLVRNLDDEDLKVRLKRKSSVTGKQVSFPTGRRLSLPAKTAYYLPVDFKVSDDVTIIYSTSEILFKKQIGDTLYVAISGAKKQQAEMLVQASAKPETLSGSIEVKDHADGTLIKYSHAKPPVFRIGSTVFACFEDEASLKLWLSNDMIIHTDIYHLDSVADESGKTDATILLKEGSQLMTALHVDRDVSSVTLDGNDIPFTNDPATGAVSFDVSQEKITGNTAEFDGHWRYMTDSAEIAQDFDDSDWDTIPSDIPLEHAGYFEHGFYWYRADFDLPEGETDNLRIDFQTNGHDRHLVYLNGTFLASKQNNYWHKIGHVAKPGKNTMVVLYANEFHTKAHAGCGEIQKVSGLFKPLTVLGTIDGEEFEHCFPEYKVRYGLGGTLAGFAEPDYDDSSWMTMPDAKRYLLLEEAGVFGWFRRNFKYNKRADCEAPLYVKMNGMSEHMLIYVNGEAIGRHENGAPQDLYYIPEHLLKEDNVMTVYLESPGYHYRVTMGFRPAYFEDLDLGFYYEARRAQLTIE